MSSSPPGPDMRPRGLHHVTCICADAPRNVDFYARVLGMRLVKQTVNFDAPEIYHLYYGDETGAPGSVLTFFEFPDAAQGRAGAGMIHLLQFRVRSQDALAFWRERFESEGVANETTVDGTLRFRDPDGLVLELVVVDGAHRATFAEAAGIPSEHALRGFHGARAYAQFPTQQETVMTDLLGFEQGAPGHYLLGEGPHRVEYVHDPAPSSSGIPGAGTVHHIAWAIPDEARNAWHERLVEAGAHATPVIDRQYFESIYFREPRGVLFELATLGPGFAIDEQPDHLGERLCLPERYEPLRERLEATLTPLVNPRAAGASR